MKQMGCALWIAMYLATAVGLPFTLHFCGQQLSDVSILMSSDESPCQCKGGTMTKGCCTSEVISLDIDSDEITWSSQALDEFGMAASEYYSWRPVTPQLGTTTAFFCRAAEPPPQAKRFIAIRVLRI